MKKIGLGIFFITISLLSYSQNWTQLNSPAGRGYLIGHIGNSMFSVTDKGLYISSDTGLTWHFQSVPPLAYVFPTIIGNSIFCCTQDGVYRSQDLGITWDHILITGFPCYYIHEDAGVLYVSNSWMFIKKSFDGGISWTNSQYFTNFGSDKFSVNGNIIIHYNYQDFYISTDTGFQYTQPPSTYAITNINDVYIGNGIILTGTSHGIFMSTDNGQTWSNNSDVQDTVNVEHINKIDTLLYAITGDGVFTSADEGFTWDRISYELAYSVDVMVGETLTTGFSYKRSPDNGLTWSYSGKGINNSSVGKIIAVGDELYINTTNPFRVGMFYTPDWGNTWSHRIPELVEVQMELFLDNNVLFAGMTGGKIYRSSDKGITWGRSDSGIIGQFVIGDLKINNNVMMAAMSYGAGHVFSSVDNGASWIPADNNLPNYNLTNLISLANFGSDVYCVLPDTGIYRTSDHGANWYKATTFPDTLVKSVYSFNNFLITTSRRYSKWCIHSYNVSTSSWDSIPTPFLGTQNGYRCMAGYNNELIISISNPEKIMSYNFITGSWTEISNSYFTALDIPTASLTVHGDTLIAGTLDNGIWVTNLPLILSTSNVKDEDASLFIYPNPVSNLLHFRINKSLLEKSNVSIYHLSGEKKIETTINVDFPEPEFNIDVSGLSPGMYFLHIRNKHSVITSGFVKN